MWDPVRGGDASGPDGTPSGRRCDRRGLGTGKRACGLFPPGKQPAQRSSVQTDKIDQLEPFTRIDIRMDYADITIEESDHFSLEYELTAWEKPVISVKNGCLTISQPPHNYGNNRFFLSAAVFPALYTTAGTAPENISQYIFRKIRSLTQCMYPPPPGKRSCPG